MHLGFLGTIAALLLAGLICGEIRPARGDGVAASPDAGSGRVDNVAAGRTYVLEPQPSRAYPDPAGRALTDGKRAAANQLHDGWVGFDQGMPSIALDLGEARRVERVEVGFLSLASAGIRPPSRLKLSSSMDGRRWKHRPVPHGAVVGDAIYDLGGVDFYARYLRVELERQEWLFLDEIEVIGSSATNAELEQPVEDTRDIAVLTATTTEYDPRVDRLENLLDGMGLPYKVLGLADIPGADLTDYQLIIIAGSESERFKIDAGVEQALVLAERDGVNLLWIGPGIWGSFRSTYLPDAFGIRYLHQGRSTDFGAALAPFTNLAGEADRLTLLEDVLAKVEPTGAEVLEWYLDASGRPTDLPFITEYRNRDHGGRAVYVSLPLMDQWKYTEAPDSFARAEVLDWCITRMTDAGIVGKHSIRDAKEGAITLRLEDYTPGGTAMGHADRVWLLRMQSLLDLARDQGLPINIGLVPKFAHPFVGEHHDWASDDPAISVLRRQAQQALDQGGALIVHGYQHQNGAEPDDFSGDDWEMWDEDARRFLSLPEQRAITDQAFAEVARRWGIEPRIWETPHYEANADTYRAAAASGFRYVNESDTKLFPNRFGYLGRIAGLLLNLPETGFNLPLDPEAIKTSTIVKQKFTLPRLVRLRGYFNFFYHNSSMQQEKALRNLLASAERFDLWKPNLEDLATFWEQRERVGIVSRADPARSRIVAEVNDSFPGFALVIRLPDGAKLEGLTVDGEPTSAASRRVGDVWLVDVVMRSAGAHEVVARYSGATAPQ